MGDQSARIGLGWLARIGAPVAIALLVANCAAGTTATRVKNTNYSPKVVADGEPVPRGGGSFKLGNPYTINGRTYYPSHDPAYRAEGIASWYGADFHGRKTANGEVYDMNGISAAHPTMPMPSYARVTNLENGRSIVVRVNDRGPYAHGRIIDLSTGTAKALGTYGQGWRGSGSNMSAAPGLPAATTTRCWRPCGTARRRPRQGASAWRRRRRRSWATRDPNATPLPPERPFFLGDASYRPPRTATPPAPPPTQPKRARTPVSVTPEYAVSEPAAAPERAPSLGLMSGRGLY